MQDEVEFAWHAGEVDAGELIAVGVERGAIARGCRAAACSSADAAWPQQFERCGPGRPARATWSTVRAPCRRCGRRRRVGTVRGRRSVRSGPAPTIRTGDVMRCAHIGSSHGKSTTGDLDGRPRRADRCQQLMTYPRSDGDHRGPATHRRPAPTSSPRHASRFGADGYERTTLRAVAADVGVDPALVIRYFGSKQDLFAAAAEFTLDLPDLTGGATPTTSPTRCCPSSSPSGRTTPRSSRCCARR